MSIEIPILTNCARCGEVHYKLTFAALTHPCGDLTHWCPCPTNGEPIMLTKSADVASPEAIEPYRQEPDWEPRI